jgi:Asp-tRNA(Asn)/Glu-tRNA(Gln) amidotransferase A subunit family amidase
MLQAIAGLDARESIGLEPPVRDYLSALCEGVKAPRIGIPRAFFFDDLDPEVDSAVSQALSVIASMSTEIHDVDLSVPTDRTLQSAESYAYHAEFVARSPELYQPETLRRLRAGETISASELIERCRELEQTRREIGRIFENVDLLVTPTTPIPAPALAELKEHPERLRPQELLLLRNTRPVNMWGLPAISIPCGFTQAGLPIGLQIIGLHGGEAGVLQLAHAYEQATEWHKRRPKLGTETATPS